MTDDSPFLVTAADAARLLNVSAGQLYKWRRSGYGPEPVDVGLPEPADRALDTGVLTSWSSRGSR